MHIMITGGVGFIGTNCVRILARRAGIRITVIDNFSRADVHHNARYITQEFPHVSIIKSSVEQVSTYLSTLKRADVVIHLAGQTAVTTSIHNPHLDFTSNVLAGFTLLDALRAHNPQATLLYASTNKVYGDLTSHTIVQDTHRKHYWNQTYPHGINESHPVDFISPYGCSKGAIDFYIQDYAHTYGMNTVVLRQSCIYGPFQMGVEDQGWVAHFSKQVIRNKPITIFGNGHQVRDLLHVDDLVRLYEHIIERIEKAKGQVFNVGGGISNSQSLLQAVTLLERKIGTKPHISFAHSRVGDQLWFVSDNTKAEQILHWRPHIDIDMGIDDLITWQKTFYASS